MKHFIVVYIFSFISFFCSTLDCKDLYKSSFKTNFKVDKEVFVSSKFLISDTKLIRSTYYEAKKSFFEFWGFSRDQCDLDNLYVYIVAEKDLINPRYFPGEKLAPSGFIIYGRYFREKNKLYIVPPDLSIYYWRKYFAHELAHYFFDDCGIKFPNNYVEHKFLDKFIKYFKLISDSPDEKTQR